MSLYRSSANMKTLLAVFLAGSAFLATKPVLAGDDIATETHPAKVAPQHSPQSTADWHSRHSLYYKRNWGIDVVGVRPVSSGQMLAFRYRVVDTEKAKPLLDKATKPYLIDAATGTMLAVPAMENVGELRQSTAPDNDRTYFMIFGNPGKLVKSGSQVSVVMGNFRIDELVVE